MLCPNCHAECPPEAAYCSACGAPLAPVDAAAEVAVPRAPHRSAVKWLLPVALVLVAVLVFLLIPKTQTVWLCTKTRFYDNDGQLRARGEYTYDKEGNPLFFQMYDAADAPSGYTEYTYQNGGRKVLSRSYDADGAPGSWVKTVYDAKGNPTEIQYGVDGSEMVDYTCQYTYDGHGNRIAQQYFDSEGVPGNRTEWTYDNKGNKLGEQYYDTEGNRSDWTEHTYDAQGNDLGYNYYNWDGSPSSRMEYSYDKAGNRVASFYYYEGVLSSRTESIYDNAGNLLHEQTYNADGTPGGWREYSYDKAGNETLLRLDHNGDGKMEIWQEYTYEAFQVPKNSLAAQLYAQK